MIYIFDFDCTITSRHWYMFIHRPDYTQYNNDLKDNRIMMTLRNDVRYHLGYDKTYTPYYTDFELVDTLKKNFFGCIERYDKLVEMLQYVKKYNNTIIILSNGYSQDIEWLLDKMEIRSYFGDVIGMVDSYQEKKQNNITKVDVLHDYTFRKHRSVFYVDDTHQYHTNFINRYRSSLIPVQISHHNLLYFSITSTHRYIFYGGLILDGTGMSVNDMEVIKHYAINSGQTPTESVYSPMIRTEHEQPKPPYVESKSDGKSLYAVDKDPFAEPSDHESDDGNLPGGRYYKLYKKNKNNNNRL